MMRLSLILPTAASVLVIAGCGEEPRDPVEVSGDPRAGRILMEGYNCGSCHVIPGIPTATGQTGPELDFYARRVYVAGVLPNTQEELVRWIVDPPEVDPRTAMPDLGVAPQQARDMAAYLYLRTGD